MKLLAFGEVLWDVYPDKSYIGGAPLNFAAHSARLGIDTFLLSAVGDDELGGDTLNAMDNLKVKTDYVGVVDNKQTGKCLVTLSEQSIPSYNLLSDVAWDYICFNGRSLDFDALYFGTLALRSEHNRNTLNDLLEKESFKEIFVDVNIRPPFYNRETINYAFKKASILKISDEELEITLKATGINFSDDLESVAKQISSRFPNIKLLIITRGGDGSVAFDAVNQSFYTAAPAKADVVSAVGAGDSFSAAFLSKYLKNESIKKCLQFASRVAGFVVSHYEAVPEYEISNFE